MDERHLEPEHPLARKLVDQLGASSCETLKLAADIVDLKSDVVHAWAALGEELPDRRVRPERGEQLDAALADAHRRRLDSLVTDGLAVLELGPEEPLVGVDGLVEVGDCDTEVMDPACFHSQRCYRLEKRARTCESRVVRFPLAAVVVTLGLLAGGCGSKKASAPTSNGVAAKTAAQIVVDVRAAMKSATAVHVAGSGLSSGSKLVIDLHLDASKGGEGFVSVGGISFDIVRIGAKAYFKGGPAFLKHYAGTTGAQLFKGKWFYAPANTGDFASFTPLTNLVELANALVASPGKVTKGKQTTIDGQPAIAITAGGSGGTLYVATTGKPYPLEVKAGGGETGTITFTGWDEPSALVAPKDAINYTKLTAAAG
jgi:hypothetical protein